MTANQPSNNSNTNVIPNGSINILQINLNRSRCADDILTQAVHEERSDIVLVSEPYRNRSDVHWFADTTNSAAIWISNSRNIPLKSNGTGDCFSWISTTKFSIFSCYFSPNIPIQEFRQKLETLEDVLQSMTGYLIVAGDFNARAIEWGMPKTNTRGRLIIEMCARLGLIVANTGSKATYTRPGYGNSIPDITLVSDSTAVKIHSWKVLDVFSSSDHNYIKFKIDYASFQNKNLLKPRCWNVNKIAPGKFVKHIKDNQNAINTSSSIFTKEDVERIADAVLDVITKACDSSMPKKKIWSGRPQAYFWTDEIASLRRKCLRLRRSAQRARNRPDLNVKLTAFNIAKKELRNAVKASKRRCWRELCEDINNNPWGLGYKLVTKKLGSSNNNFPMAVSDAKKIVDELFPTHQPRTERDFIISPEEVPLFTDFEIRSAAQTLKNKKAPGPDGVPSEVIKLVADHFPNLMKYLFNECLKVGVFPTRWKSARLILLDKGKGGNPQSASSYRPLCMLDGMGKLLEKLIRNRLQAAIEAAGDYSDNQHGFRKGHSTINAVKQVVTAVHQARNFSYQARPIVLLVTLDVKNAFNSLQWADVLNALENKFNAPKYLLRIIDDYLKNRRVLYDTDRGVREKEMTAGAAQGSVLGPDLWNIMYDGLLRIETPDNTSLVGYADDVAAIITARDIEIAQIRLAQIMRRVSTWINAHGLQLALEKTEVVLLTGRRIERNIHFQINDIPLENKHSIKYLGVVIDRKLNFREHILKACNKAAAMTAALGRIMTNVRGPRASKRRLLFRAAESIVLYGAEIYADATKKRKNRVQMYHVQRQGALRISSAYRTVSEPAIFVVAGLIPWDLLAQERKRIFDSGNGRAIAAQMRNETIGEWQRRWEGETRGRWTAEIIPEVQPWIGRKHGEVNFYLTQFLTGHGYFRKYLFKMGKVNNPACKMCNTFEDDDVRHTFFGCSYFHRERVDLFSSIGVHSPPSLVQEMLRSSESWELTCVYLEGILRKKKDEGALTDEVHPG